MTFLGTAKRFRTVVPTDASRTTDDIRDASRIPYDTSEATLGTVLAVDDPTAVASFTEGWWMYISVR